MTNPIGSGFLAALAMGSVALANGGNDTKSTSRPSAEAAPQESDTTVKAKAGEGITFKSDGYELNLSTFVQVNLGYTNNRNAGATDAFGVTIRRARTELSGSAYRDTVHFLARFEWADGQGSDVLDALLLWDFWSNEDASLQFRFGQGRTLFGTEATVRARYLEFVDRALATQTFANRRSPQAQVVGRMAGGQLRFNAGILNNDVAAAHPGSGIDDSPNGGTELNYIVGVAYGTGQDSLYHEGYREGTLEVPEETMWVVNSAISYGQNDSTGPGGIEYDAVTWNAGGAMKMDHIHVLAEFFVRNEDVDRPAGGLVGRGSSAYGWQAQASWTGDKGEAVQWGFGGRLSHVRITGSNGVGAGLMPVPGLLGEGRVFEAQAVATAYYFGHDLKTQIGYTIQQVSPDAAGADHSTNHRIEVQSQIVF